MNFIRKLQKSERVFYENKKEEIEYNKTCLACTKPCKQSFRVQVVVCKGKDTAHVPQEYIKEINKQKKDIDTIGKEIGINSRTVKSMLHENQDMSFEVYDKLDKLLFPDSKRNKSEK